MLLLADSTEPSVKTSGHVHQSINGYASSAASMRAGYADSVGGDSWYRGFIWYDVSALSNQSRFTLVDSIEYTLSYAKSSKSSNAGCPSSKLLVGAIDISSYNAWSTASGATRWTALKEPLSYVDSFQMPCSNGSGSTTSQMTAFALQDLTRLLYDGGQYFGIGFDEYPRATGGNWYDDSTWIQIQSLELTIRSLVPPTHSAPAGSLATLTPTLSWNRNGSVSGLTNSRWRVQIATEADFFPATDIVWSAAAPLSDSSINVPAGTLQWDVHYWWRVIPENPNVPFYVPPSTALGFIASTGSTNPGTFSKTTPGDSAVGQSATATLSWTSSSAATSYSVCIDDTDNGACDAGAFFDVGNVQSWSVTGLYGAGLAANTTYYWQVRARNNSASTEADSGTWYRFTTASPSGPGTFSKSAPQNNASGQSNMLTLSWTASSSATGYGVCIDDTDNNACDAGAYLNVGDVLSWAVTGLYSAGLGYNKTYYWQVRARNDAGNTDADGGTWYRFTTSGASGPGAFSKSTPGHTNTGQSNTATLTWTASSGASAYSICIDDTDNSSCDMGAFLDAGDAQSWAVTGLYPAGLGYNTTYYWQVRARNGNGTTDADGGTWYRFTTAPATAPGAFSKSAPQNASSGVSNTTTLTWTPSSGATFYGLCLQNGIGNGGMCDVGAYLNLGNVSSWAVTGLYPLGMAFDTTYYWNVRAFNGITSTDADGGTWHRFTTVSQGPGAFGKSAPSNTSSAQSAATTLNWTASSGATGYSICLDDTPDNSCDGGNFIDVGNVLYWAITDAYRDGLAANKTYYWQVRARNSAGGTTDGDHGTWWSFATLTSPATLAAYDSTLKVPTCGTPSAACDSGSLLSGRDSLATRNEAGQPNTLSASCGDGSAGTYHSDESIERIVVASTDGGLLSPGSVARVAVTVWVYSQSDDLLDLYYTASAVRPSWVHFGTLTPTGSREQTLELTFTLPRGGLQAIRAAFRFGGSVGACPTGIYDEADDLAFAVTPDPFTDASLSSASTLVRAVHITELRSRIAALRSRYELPVYSWTDPSLGPGTVIRAVHVTELRAALSAVYAAAGRSTPTFIDATITARYTWITAAHITQLRQAVTDIE